MIFTALTALLLPVAILAAPTGKPTTDDADCKPISYTMTEYIIAASSTYHFVSFNVQSSYTVNAQVDDRVAAGANCEADGTEIRSGGNLCNVAGNRFNDLVFDLIEGSSDADYRLYHKWHCNGATWISENDIDLHELECNVKDNEDNEDDITVSCTSKPIIFAPQKVRKISGKDDKKAANKAGAAKPPAQAKAKAADCHNCTLSASL